jgi:hypothetical protein
MFQCACGWSGTVEPDSAPAELVEALGALWRGVEASSIAVELHEQARRRAGGA